MQLWVVKLVKKIIVNYFEIENEMQCKSALNIGLHFAYVRSWAYSYSSLFERKIRYAGAGRLTGE